MENYTMTAVHYNSLPGNMTPEIDLSFTVSMENYDRDRDRNRHGSVNQETIRLFCGFAQLRVHLRYHNECNNTSIHLEDSQVTEYSILRYNCWTVYVGVPRRFRNTIEINHQLCQRHSVQNVLHHLRSNIHDGCVSQQLQPVDHFLRENLRCAVPRVLQEPGDGEESRLLHGRLLGFLHHCYHSVYDFR